MHVHDITVSCDSPIAIPSLIASIVVAVIAMYGEYWLAWLSKVCNYELHYNYWIMESSHFCKFGVGSIHNL